MSSIGVETPFLLDLLHLEHYDCTLSLLADRSTSSTLPKTWTVQKRTQLKVTFHRITFGLFVSCRQ